MKKTYRRLFSMVLIFAITIFAVFPANASQNAQTSKTLQNQKNQEIITLLNQNDIKAFISDDTVVLSDLSDISNANNILQNNYIKKISSRSDSQYMGPYDEYFYTKKFQKASKTALTSTMVAWASGLKIPQALITTFIGSFFSYWFIESDEVDIYAHVAYYYYEMGPGSFDSMGNFIGDYALKKTIRVTNNSDYTGGEVTEEYEYHASILYPF